MRLNGKFFFKNPKLKILTFINILVASIFFLTTNGILWGKSVLVSFMYPLVPAYFLINLFFLLFLILLRTRLVIVPGLILILFFHQIYPVFNPGLGRKRNITPDFQTLSYNVSGFNVKNGRFAKELDEKQLSLKEGMIKWIKENPAGIKCFQEFYHSEFPEEFNLIDRIRDSTNVNYCYAFSKLGFGVITFSKYPIVNSGEVFKSENGYNRGIFTDVVINRDTVRIINVHLQSTTAKAFHPLRSPDPKGMLANFRIMLHKIKTAHMTRLGQVEEVLEFVAGSPYDVVLCGDLNATPFSYTYRAIRNHLKSSFESGGKGFGFTLNSRILFFLRIDHQFYSSNLSTLKLDTENDVFYSDHFPLTGSYKLSE